MKRLVSAMLIGATITALGYDSFEPHQAGEVTDFWDTRAYENAAPVTASGTMVSCPVSNRTVIDGAALASEMERSNKTSAMAELAIRIKRYAAQGLTLLLK